MPKTARRLHGCERILVFEARTSINIQNADRKFNGISEMVLSLAFNGVGNGRAEQLDLCLNSSNILLITSGVVDKLQNNVEHSDAIAVYF